MTVSFNYSNYGGLPEDVQSVHGKAHPGVGAIG